MEQYNVHQYKIREKAVNIKIMVTVLITPPILKLLIKNTIKRDFVPSNKEI